MKVNNKNQENLLSGFIDVKIPPKGRKLGPWKAWRRQWCIVQKSSTDNSVELALGNNSRNVNNRIIVPHFATLCRSESRTRPFAFGIFLPENKNHRAVVFLSGRSETESQQLMAHIRTLLHPQILPVLGEEFSVSLIDNQFSRSSGLFGIYGILSLNDTEMVIRNPTNGEKSASWKWSQIEHNYVRESTQNVEDLGKIFVFKVRCGNKTGGKLYLFCLQAVELQSAVLQYRLGRQRRLVTSPLPPTPPHPGYFGYHSMRRLSRSEGDLRWPLESSVALLNLRSRSNSRERNSKSLGNGDDEKDINSLGKVARSLILASASFSLLLSTPGCSEPDSLHEYQPISNYHDNDNDSTDDDASENKSFSCERSNRSQSDIDHDSENDDVGDLFSYFRSFSAPCRDINSRRVSGASVASGIYAEIDENPDNSTESDSKYQNLSDFSSDCWFNLQSMKPPPLPPRRTNEHFRNRCKLQENSSNDLSVQFTKNEIDEQNKELSKINRRQEQNESDNQPESEYIMINVKETEENINEEITKTQPPPLPPRRLCDIIGSTERSSNMADVINLRENQEFRKCDKKEKQVPQMSEPDYLPMSQVPMKMPINEDTYVVMANIINNMSVTTAESGS